MSTTNRGEIYWLYPEKESTTAKIGLVLESDDEESLFMMCHPDVRLAGHLDAIFEPRQTALPFSIAAFTHVVVWFTNARISTTPIAQLSEEICDDLELARSGRQTQNLRYGLHLADPLIEPRWPMIQRIAIEFIDELAESNYSGNAVKDRQSFEQALSVAIAEWRSEEISHEERILVRANLHGLAEILLENPNLFDIEEFSYLTDDILGTHLVVELV